MPDSVTKNKPVGHHEVDYLLSCNHINAEEIEAAIFIPRVGEKRICTHCKRESTISRVNSPYWVDLDETK